MATTTAVRSLAGVPYRATPQGTLRLNLFLPEHTTTPRPAVLFLHGGGWREGRPEQFTPQATALALQGFVTASAQYRFAAQAHFPAAVVDAKAAMRWLRAHAAEYGLNRDRIAVAGGSAGGHLAALVATTGQTDLFVEDDNRQESSAAQLAILFNAVTDMRFSAPVLSDFLGASLSERPDLYTLASPISHVNATTPPTLLLHGAEDGTVPYAQSMAFAEALRSCGVEAELFTAEGARHGFFNQPPWYQPAFDAMLAFLQRHWVP